MPLETAFWSLLSLNPLALLPLILALTLAELELPEGCWHFQGAKVKTLR